MSSLMPHLSGPFRCLLAALVLLPALLSAATEVHVAPAPAGNDADPGTALQPVATPQGAQVRVRALIQAGLSNAVEVIFAAGTYQMDAPLELRPEDSGTAAFQITWKAAINATVVLSGGKPITGTWTNGGGIWHTDLTGVGLGTNQWNFRQLFVNGHRAVRARYPNATQANPFLYATGGSTSYVIINPALVKASWGTAADAQINIVPQSRFFNQWNTVTGVNTNTGRMDIADSERHRTIDSGSWFWIEGVQAELDEPNEWFLDPTTGRLYYMPTNGVNPNSLEIVVPYLNRIINVKGDVNAGTHVQHVNFDGLEFRYTDFTLGQIEPRVDTDTAIMFENTSDSSVKNCRFVNVGGYALWMHLDSQRNVFDHNLVSYPGGGGVLLTGSRFAYMDDSKIYTPGEAAAKVAPILNQITYNTVEHCGKIRYYGGGVHLDSRPFSMTMSPGNYIAHNHFNDLSRNGIFAFRNQGGNVVEYNHIHNCMLTTIDGGAIHFATMNHLNAPNFILNNWLYDIWGYRQKPNGIVERASGNGAYLDWDTSNTTVKDNWIYNFSGSAVKVIFGGNWNVVNVSNQSSSTVITPPFVAEVGTNGTASNGIDLANNKFTGSVIHYTDSEHFSTNGTWTQESAVGLANLFIFDYLVGRSNAPSQAIYTLPITEDGTYQISLLYKPGSDRASNVPIAIANASGISNVTWNMQTGSSYGFAVSVGYYQFLAAQTNTLTLFTTNANGKVIADSVGFVKIDTNTITPANASPSATGLSVSGMPAEGAQLTGSYTYGDEEGDPEAASIIRWYRSDDATLDAGDTVVAGVSNIAAITVKTSTAYSTNRLASNLFNTNGTTAVGEELLNLDGSEAGEPVSADNVSWVTPSGSESTLLSNRKVWFVADLGASQSLNQVRIWNFQWNHSSGDLSDRGISQFDLYVRNSAADTTDGTSGGTAINTNLSVAAFNLGSSNQWQLVLTNQSLAQAPNADNYTGQTFPFRNRNGRFVAIVANSYYLGNGVALGKVRVQSGQGTLNYTPVAADIGKYLIFQVTPVAASGTPIGEAQWAATGLIGGNNPPTASRVVITGVTAVGATVQGSYSYHDAEGDAEGASVFQWYRGNDATFDAGDVAISGATNQSYVVQPADTGYYLFFEVTPVALTGVSVGSASQSAPVHILETAGFIQKLGSDIPQRIVFYGTSLTASGIWISQMQSAVDGAYPGLVTWINSGGSGMASDWGVSNLQTKVIDQNPDVVFIEFSVNDAAVTLNISRAQALANLSNMVTRIRAARTNCEIILQVMNPVDRRDTDTYSPRPDLALYQQDYRDFAATNGLQCIDHMPAFQALLDEGSDAYRVFVPDGVHPSAEGFARYMTPVLLQAIGLAPEISPDPDIVIDNSDPAPSIVLNGLWTSSTSTPGYIGTNYVHNGNTGQGSKSAVFTPNIPSNGVYPLFLHWTSESNRATNAPVTVNYNGGSTNMTVNQTLNGGTWFNLGSYPFAAGTNGTVTIGTTAANGYVIVDALGVGLSQTSTVVRLRMDNGRAAEPASPQGVARDSTLIVWRSGSTQEDLTVQLSFTGGSALSGSDYTALPTNITIFAGRSSAAVQLRPLYDLLVEGDETFKASLVSAAGYSTGYPNKASIVFEDRVGSENAPPVASNLIITGTTAIGATVLGSYNYSDAENDAEGTSLFQWFRSDDGILDAGDTAIAGATNSSYTVQAGDSGKTLFFQVTPRAATGSPTGSAAASGGVPIPAAPPGASKILIKEDFGGTGAALHGTTADTFDAAITAAGGSSTWVAAANFLDNGAVTLATRQAAYLNLGNYINNARGTAAGLFNLTMTIWPTTGTWISLGFATNNTPNTLKDFTDTGSGAATAVGMATILYRATNATPTANALACFAGPKSALGFGNITGITGNRTVAVTLDLTPAVYNGSTTFGKVTWSDSVLGTLTNYSYTTEPNFRSILISDSATSSGTISSLTLTQIWPPVLQITLNGANLDFQWGSRAGKRYDLVATNKLAAPIATWPPYRDGVTTYTNIPAYGTGLNVLTNVVKIGPTKFFILIEKP